MFIDLSVPVTAAVREQALSNERMAALGHLGTHFDVMDKPFPLRYLERSGIVFNVQGLGDRDVEPEDVDLALVREDMFVAFATGHVERVGYGTEAYFAAHPQLSRRLIDGLVERRISVVGIDSAGIRRGAGHTPTDQFCADRGVFVVENLCNLATLLDGRKHRCFTAHVYPIHFLDMTGLPCRVVAEI